MKLHKTAYAFTVVPSAAAWVALLLGEVDEVGWMRVVALVGDGLVVGVDVQPHSTRHATKATRA